MRNHKEVVQKINRRSYGLINSRRKVIWLAEHLANKHEF